MIGLIAMLLVTTAWPAPARPDQSQPAATTPARVATSSDPQTLTRILRETGDHRERRFLAPAPAIRGVVHALIVPVVATARGEVAATPVELLAGPEALRPDPDLPRRSTVELRGTLPGPGTVTYPVWMEIELRDRASRLFVAQSEAGLVPHPLLAVCLQVDRVDRAGAREADGDANPATVVEPSVASILRSGVPGELLTNPIHSDQFRGLDEIVEQLATRRTGLGASGRLYVAGHELRIRHAMEQERGVDQTRPLGRSRAVGRLVREGVLHEGELLELHVYVRVE